MVFDVFDARVVETQSLRNSNKIIKIVFIIISHNLRRAVDNARSCRRW